MAEALVEQGLEVLTEEECLRLVGRSSVGRVGVTIGALPAIFPVNFIYQDGAIWFRTGEGTKLSAAAHGSVVAFEVDHADTFEHGGWSVLMVGTAEAVTDPARLDALSQLRLRPWADGDRDRLVRIAVEFVSGRRIVRGGGSW